MLIESKDLIAALESSKKDLREKLAKAKGDPQGTIFYLTRELYIDYAINLIKKAEEDAAKENK